MQHSNLAQELACGALQTPVLFGMANGRNDPDMVAVDEMSGQGALVFFVIFIPSPDPTPPVQHIFDMLRQSTTFQHSNIPTYSNKPTEFQHSNDRTN